MAYRLSLCFDDDDDDPGPGPGPGPGAVADVGRLAATSALTCERDLIRLTMRDARMCRLCWNERLDMASTFVVYWICWDSS